MSVWKQLQMITLFKNRDIRKIYKHLHFYALNIATWAISYVEFAYQIKMNKSLFAKNFFASMNNCLLQWNYLTIVSWAEIHKLFGFCNV